MEHRKHHLLEKTQVQLTAIVAMICVYFLAWPMFRPNDPLSPITMGNVWSFIKVGILLLVVTGIATLLTLRSRPEGAILCALLAVAGISVRSPSAGAMLMVNESSLNGIFIQNGIDMLFLSIAIAIAAATVQAIRSFIDRLKPDLMWRPPWRSVSSQRLKDSEKFALLAESLATRQVGLLKTIFFGGHRKIDYLRSLGCLLISSAMGMVLLIIMLQSTDRGQVIFALFISFMLSSLVADQICPTSIGVAAWGGPIVASMAIYALCALQTGTNVEQPWLLVRPYGYTLPIDWLGAGCGGSVLGYWFSERILEVTLLEGKIKKKT